VCVCVCVCVCTRASARVCVALVMQHAMHMRHIVICGLPALQYFPHCLTNGTIFEKKKLLITKWVF